MLIEQKPRAGRLLVAEPFMEDSNFRRTVLLLCEHNRNGSFGFVLNRKLDIALAEAIPDLDFFDSTLYYGGPMEQDTLHFLHTYGKMIEGSVKLGNNIYWGGNFEQLTSYINTRQIEPTNIRFYLGYAGWGKNQLAEEMKNNSWIVTRNKYSYIFSNTSKQLWREVLRDIGDDHYRIMSHFPEYPALN